MMTALEEVFFPSKFDYSQEIEIKIRLCFLTLSLVRRCNYVSRLDQARSDDNRICSTAFQFDVNLIVETSLVNYIFLLIGSVAALTFLGSLIFICWWNVCKLPKMHQEDKVTFPGRLVCTIIVAERLICGRGESRRAE